MYRSSDIWEIYTAVPISNNNKDTPVRISDVNPTIHIIKYT